MSHWGAVVLGRGLWEEGEGRWVVGTCWDHVRLILSSFALWTPHKSTWVSSMSPFIFWEGIQKILSGKLSDLSCQVHVAWNICYGGVFFFLVYFSSQKHDMNISLVANRCMTKTLHILVNPRAILRFGIWLFYKLYVWIVGSKYLSVVQKIWETVSWLLSRWHSNKFGLACYSRARSLVCLILARSPCAEVIHTCW